MNTGNLIFAYDNRLMRFSGIFRCIFTGEPLMWMIHNRRFYFFKFDAKRTFLIVGPQGSGKTTFAMTLKHKLESMGKIVRVHDEIENARKLTNTMTAEQLERDKEKRILMKGPDLVVYCVQDHVDISLPIMMSMTVFTLQKQSQ